MPGIARTRFRLARFNVIALLFVLALPGRGETQGADVLRIYIARHGQTDWNVEGRLQGGTDVPLNATGRRQAVELAERLKGVQLDAIYSSALKRSSDTAAVVAGSARLTSLPGLNERRLGKFEGQKLARSTTAGASAGASPSNDPLTREYDQRLVDPRDALDGGESLEQFAARVAQATKVLLATHRSGAILIVGHAMTNQMIVKGLLDLTLEQASGIQMSNDELYLLEIGGGVAPRLWKRVTVTNIGDL